MKRIFLEVFFLLIAAGATACVDRSARHQYAAGQQRWLAQARVFIRFHGSHVDLFVRRPCRQAQRLLLLAAGARADAKAQPGGCPSDSGIQTGCAGRSGLLHVDAGWRRFVGARGVQHRNSPRELSLGDCELVEQFRAQVLPMFATRNLDDRRSAFLTKIPGR